MKKISIQLDLPDVLKLLGFYDWCITEMDKAANSANGMLRRNVIARVAQETKEQLMQQITTEDL